MTVAPPKTRKLPLAVMFRLGLYQACLGMMSVLTLGILNRVLIDELKIPALIAAGAIAMHQFVAPVRVWFGQLSDRQPLFGLHRSGYIGLGAVGFCAIAILASQTIWPLGTAAAGGFTGAAWGWAALLAGLFACYGIALSSSSTPFAALLVDISDEEERAPLVSIVWSMLTVGIVVGAILSSTVLGSACKATATSGDIQSGLSRLFLLAGGGALATILLATWGVERRWSRFTERSTPQSREDQIGIRQAWATLSASPQTLLFFAALATFTISLFLQEAVLEPFGGEVFGMSICETTRLNAIWGMGTLVGIASTGFLVVPRLGKRRTALLGCGLSALSFVGIALSGFVGNAVLFKGLLGVFGVAAGIGTNGALCLMLDLTLAETAGTFLGAWGLAQALSRAVATVSGGAVLDLGKILLEPRFGLAAAYSSVFLLEAVGMVVAIALLRRVDIRAFRQDTRTRLSDVLSAELD